MKQHLKKLIPGCIALFAGAGLGALSICSSCKKGFLDEKPKQSIVLLNTIKNLQGALDNSQIINIANPGLGEDGADDYYFTSDDFLSVSDQEDRNAYLWASTPDFYDGPSVNDWDFTYRKIFIANTVLEEIDKITPAANEQADWANVKGTALFYRAYFYYALAQIFCKPYIPLSADNDLGIVLRLEPDINQPSVRASVKDTYNQIVNDLIAAKDLLPNTQLYKTRPSRLAAYAMLARVFLTMQDYDKAYQYANSSLQTFNALIDFNTLDTTAIYPFMTFNNNPEIMFYCYMVPHLAPISTHLARVDTALVKLYDGNDLRKDLFFYDNGGRLQVFGNYTATSVHFFEGLASNELYLIRAECLVRKGNKDAGLNDLDSLLIKRWRTGTFSNTVATDTVDALRKILTERRKELCFRGIRWSDLRRLNQDSRFEVTLKRRINGQDYLLYPNDKKYVYPIPNSEILYSGIPQNPR